MSRAEGDDVLKEARRLYKLGFAIIWIHPRSKRPVESGWTTGDRKPWVYMEKTYKSGYNVGVRTGQPSKVGGGYLACIDVDIKKPEYREAALSKLRDLVGDTVLPEVRSGSGGGSRHLYCWTKGHFKMLTIAKVKDAWEICVYSDGRQMVLPPSVHPSGKPYAWKHWPEGGIPEMSFDSWQTVHEHSNGNGKHSANGAGGDDAGNRIPKTEGLKGFEPVRVDLDWLPISERVLKGIKHGTDIVDRSDFLLPATSALHSAGLSRDEILSVLTDPDNWLSGCAFDHARTRDRRRAAEWLWKYTVRKVSTERAASSVFTKVAGTGDVGEKRLNVEEAAKQAEELIAEIDWKQNLDKTAKGKTQVTLKNVDLILSHSVEDNVFVKDLFANRIIYGADTPWGGRLNEPLQDIDLILVKRWLADTSFGIEPSTNMIQEVTSLIGHRKRIHPVREWLESLEWDGVERVNTWIKDFCRGEAEEPYLSQVSRKFLLAMVKRIFEPGCQWDYTVVLEGKQGQYKSTIARTLASDKWFMDNLPDLKDKDAMLSLQGKWLIELGELANVKRADYNLVKAYLSRRIDTVRAHYGRIAADVPRQSVFIGSVNEGQYLKDPTGNRRYWPVRVGMCDVKGLTEVRDQLFAEAMHIYRTANEILMLDKEANAQATEAQEERRVDDDETEMRAILEEFMQSEEAKEFNFDRFRARELFEGSPAPWGRFADKNYAMQTAAIVLAGMGFKRHKIGGQRVWRRPGAPALMNPNLRGLTRFSGSALGMPLPQDDALDFF